MTGKRNLSADLCDLNTLDFERVTTYCEVVLLTKPAVDTQGHKPHVRDFVALTLLLPGSTETLS